MKKRHWQFFQCRLFLLNGLKITNGRFPRLIDTNRLTGVCQAGIIGLNFDKQMCINAICNIKGEMNPKSVSGCVEEKSSDDWHN